MSEKATIKSSRCARAGSAARGVSLVEAMVALAVMAFGMLSLVGVQTTLRMNNDLAKQRSEATVIATEEMEKLRNYVTLAPVLASPGTSWDEIDGRTVEAYSPPESIGNTTYRVERRVREIANIKQKVISVEVSWPDRMGVTQRIVLNSMIWGAKPEFSGLLGVPVLPSAANLVADRHPSIPAGAQNIDGGRSRFDPPVEGQATAAWIFENATGALSVCDVNNLSSCRSARLISGLVRFHSPAAAGDPVTAANAKTPGGPAYNLANGPNALSLYIRFTMLNGISSECYADHKTAAQLDPSAVPRISGINYYCAMFSPGQPGWGGQLNVNLVNDAGSALPLGTSATDFKVCRYTLAATDQTSNIDHPKTYCDIGRDAYLINVNCPDSRVTANLINQNFLVIPGDRSCPNDTAVDLAAGKLVNSNTLQHQP